MFVDTSFMPDTRCPHCEVQSHVTIRWGKYDTDHHIGEFAATCDNCARLVIARFWSWVEGRSGVTFEMSQVSFAVKHADKLEWLPARGSAPEIKDVPASIAAAAREAHSSLSVGNFRASIMVARAVVEATAKHKGISDGPLLKKIDGLKDANLIRPDIAESAHEIRHSGNDMAHGDFGVEVVAEDAEELLAIMDEVLQEVFQGPARVERIRERRIARTSGKSESTQ